MAEEARMYVMEVTSYISSSVQHTYVKYGRSQS